MKIKLRPSARINRRYILIEAREKNVIEKVILDYIGILGWAEAAPIFVEDSNFKGKIILSVDRKAIDKVRAAFEICKEPVKILRVSGTLKGLAK